MKDTKPVGEQIYENRWIVLGVLVLLLLGTIYALTSGGSQDGDISYTAYVNDSAVVAQSSEQDTNVNVTQLVSRNDGNALPASGGSYTFKANTYMTRFTLSGIYDGNAFRGRWVDDNQNPVMETLAQFHPQDGVLNGYIAATIVDRNGEEQLKANIYIDEDFRQHVSGYPLNIVWGENWDNSRPFQTVEVAPNVYMDTIYLDDTERFIHGSQNSDANIAVGSFTEADIPDNADDIEAAVILK